MASKSGPDLYIWSPWRPRGGVLAVDFFRIRASTVEAGSWQLAVGSRRKNNRRQKLAVGCVAQSAWRKALGTTAISRVLKNPLFARRLKKAQVQGAARSEVRDVLSTYVAALRERRYTADGPFPAAC